MANASPHNAQDGGNPGGMVRNNSLLPAGQLSLESCEVPMQQQTAAIQKLARGFPPISSLPWFARAELALNPLVAKHLFENLGLP
jgi:hypothetical protein